MELKCGASSVGSVAGAGFNRTFMELKFEKDSDGTFIAYRFNRTFMELKFNLAVRGLLYEQV